MKYYIWIEREKKVREKLLKSARQLDSDCMFKTCQDCGEICLCHEKVCPNCNSERIILQLLEDSRIISERIRCRYRYNRLFSLYKEFI